MVDAYKLGLKFHGSGIAAGGAFLREHRPVVEQFVKGFLEGVAYAKQHKEESIRLIKDFMKLKDQDEAEDSYQVIIQDVQPRKPYPLKEGVETVCAISRAPSQRRKPSSLKSLIDDSIIRRMDQSGFIDASLSLRQWPRSKSSLSLALILGVAHGAVGADRRRSRSPFRAAASRLSIFISRRIGAFFVKKESSAELIQVAANVATAALMAGEVDALGAVGLAARASQSGLPIKVLAVTGHRALFWLVSRPEFKSIADLKGTTLGITSRNGSQHLVANRLLAAGGLDPAKDVTTVVIGGAPALLQALLAGSIQVTALSPPTIIVARDKFKVNILADPPKDFVSTQGGFAVTDRILAEKRDLCAAHDAGTNQSVSLFSRK